MISGEAKRGWVVHQLAKVRNFHPPIMLSLRNTFRNKSRLAFTLVTLTIAGAMFMAVLSAYDTLQSQIRDLGRYIQFDSSISIPGGANRNTAEREASRIPMFALQKAGLLAVALSFIQTVSKAIELRSLVSQKTPRQSNPELLLDAGSFHQTQMRL